MTNKYCHSGKELITSILEVRTNFFNASCIDKIDNNRYQGAIIYSNSKHFYIKFVRVLKVNV